MMYTLLVGLASGSTEFFGEHHEFEASQLDPATTSLSALSFACEHHIPIEIRGSLVGSSSSSYLDGHFAENCLENQWKCLHHVPRYTHSSWAGQPLTEESFEDTCNDEHFHCLHNVPVSQRCNYVGETEASRWEDCYEMS